MRKLTRKSHLSVWNGGILLALHSEIPQLAVNLFKTKLREICKKKQRRINF